VERKVTMTENNFGIIPECKLFGWCRVALPEHPSVSVPGPAILKKEDAVGGDNFSPRS
jgi:hypothetical protein